MRFLRRKKICTLMRRLDLALETRLQALLPRSLTARYVFGLGGLAAFSILGQVMEQATFQSQHLYFNEIRLIDMHVNETRNFGSSLREMEFETKKSLLLRELQSAEKPFSEMINLHLAIDSGRSPLRIFLGEEEREREYFERAREARQRIQVAFGDLRAFLSRKENFKDGNLVDSAIFDRLLEETIQEEISYRDAIKNLGEIYEYMLTLRIDSARVLGLMFLSMILFLLTFEALYVFRPAVKQLYEAISARTSFLSKMGHEIRNPMNSILGMTRLLQETKLTEQQRRYASILFSSSHSLMSLLNNLIDYSKMSSGKIEIDKQETDVIRSLQDAVDVFTYKVDEKQLNLVLDIDFETPQRIWTDPFILKQLLTNILGNAVKFTDRGEIVLSAWFDSSQSPPSMHFSISDTGIGIQQEKLSEIFEYFQQEDSTIVSKYGGNGLGLGICSELIRVADGKLDVESRKDIGSCFHFSIPVERFSSERFKDTFAEKKMTGRKAFVAERHPIRARKLESFIEASGGAFTVVPHREKRTDTEFWRSYFLHNEFDIYIINFEQFAYLVDALQDLHSHGKRSLLSKVIILLRSTIPSDDLISLNSRGVKSFLYTPIKPLEFHSTVNLILSQRRQARSEPLKKSDRFELARTINVLIVDDSRDNQFLLKSYLETSANSMVFAANGAEALEKFKLNRFDIVFMDILMPVMDGYDAAKAMREWERESGRTETPIVAVTAHASEDEQNKCKESGFTAHFAKPIDLRELQSYLAKLFGERQTKLQASLSDIEQAWQAKLKAYLPTYYKQRRDDLAALKAAADSGDWSVIMQIGHKIKGNAATYGFAELGEVGAKMEKEAADKDLSNIQKRIQYIENWLKETADPQ